MADEKKVKRFTSWLPLDENIDGAVLLKFRREDQRLLGCATNEDVFLEYPFAFVSTEDVKNHLQRPDSPLEPFREQINAYKETSFLFGYASTELDAEDFVVCLTQEARDAFIRRNRKITRKLREMVVNRVRKTPRPWKDLGSAEELECNFVKNTRPLIEIELTLPPSRHRGKVDKIFDDRDALDVRDGYVGILANKEDYQNVYKKKISIAIQSDLPRLDSGVQTYTGYPVNKWTQYEYTLPADVVEIWNETEDEEGTDENGANDDATFDEAELERRKRKEELQEKRKIEMEKLRDFLSRRADEMIEAIVYNAAINLYVDDISLLNEDPDNSDFPKEPKLYKELSNLLNLSLSDKRKIRHASWHYAREGVIVCCYNFSVEFTRDSKVMIWALSIDRQPIMTLIPEAHISRISFCPYEGSTDTVVGGTVDGTVLIWDLRDHFRKGTEEKLDKRSDVQDECNIAGVRATVFSNRNKSHNLRICNITWLPHWCRMTPEGTFRRKAAKSLKDRNPQFSTASKDGSIIFWELPPPSSKLSMLVSPLINMKVNNSIEPIYQLLIEEPKEKEVVRIPINSFCLSPFKAEEPPEFKDQPTLERWHKIYVGTAGGEVLCCTWTGQIFGMESSGVEKCQILTRICVHDGPVLELSSFPHLEDVFLSIGGRIWSIWKEDYMESPVLWRRTTESQYASGCWSNRIGIFVLGRIDGQVEVWDITKVSDAPVLSMSISDEDITGFFPGTPSNLNIMAICDGNSALRIYEEPSESDEEALERNEWFEEFVWRETKRKRNFASWQDEFLNHDPIAIDRRADRVAEEARRKRREAKEKFLREQEMEAKLEAERRARKRPKSKAEIWRLKNCKRAEQILLQKAGFVPSELEELRKPLIVEEELLKITLEKARVASTKGHEEFDLAVASYLPDILTTADDEFVKKYKKEAHEKESDYKKEYLEVCNEARKILSERPFVPTFNISDAMKAGRKRASML